MRFSRTINFNEVKFIRKEAVMREKRATRERNEKEALLRERLFK
jgi:hypothetical protein